MPFQLGFEKPVSLGFLIGTHLIKSIDLLMRFIKFGHRLLTHFHQLHFLKVPEECVVFLRVEIIVVHW